MKRLHVIIAIVFCSVFAKGQSPIYEKGYFIDVQGSKTECYIKLEEWGSQPKLHYLLSWKDTLRSKEFKTIKEFGLKEQMKFIRVRTTIDISSDRESLLSQEQEPEWNREELILKVLVEGKTNLYAYEKKDLTRYFFSTGESPLEQLVFKRYRVMSGVETNKDYQYTLFSRLNCQKNALEYFEKLKYNKEDLVNHFIAINKCDGVEPKIYDSPQEIAINGNYELRVSTEETKASRMIDRQGNEKGQSQTNHYLGVVANQLLRQLFNFGGNNTSVTTPYLLQYAINSKRNGNGVNVGLTYDKNSFIDNSSGVGRKTSNRTFALRIGYDHKKDWGKRWIGIWGVDVVFDGSKSITDNQQQQGNPSFTIKSNSKGWGFGPRFGLLFRLSDKILLGTDAAYYSKHVTISQTFPGQPNINQKATNANLSLPVALFLTIKLK